MAGVAALLLSAEPALRGRPDMIKQILARTADPKAHTACGAAPGGVPNNGYGWGIVNAQRAIESLSQVGILRGTVTAVGADAPLVGATVRLYLAGSTILLDSATTNAMGEYSFSRSWGSYRVEVTLPGHDPGFAEPLYVVGGQVTTQNFALVAILAVSDLQIGRLGTAASLRWTALSGNVAGYELWRGRAPYFTPGEPQTEIIADGSGPSCSQQSGIITCTDAEASGDPAVNFFYLVRAVGAGNGRSLPSNRVGEFSCVMWVKRSTMR